MGVRLAAYLLMVCALLLSACSSINTSPVAQHPESIDNPASMDHSKRFFVAHKGIEDDYEIIFHVMPAPEGEGFSRTNYHLMVSVLQAGKPVTDLTLYAMAKHPDGAVDKKAKMMRMGQWYMALYNLSHEKGQYWLTVSFEHHGKIYSSGVYYPERPYRP